jgi:hypothetical protein
MWGEAYRLLYALRSPIRNSRPDSSGLIAIYRSKSEWTGEQNEMQFRNAQEHLPEITCQKVWESRQEAFRWKRQPPKKEKAN